MHAPLKRNWIIPQKGDPRIPFAGLLASYCLLGTTVFGFNRNPWQILLTVGACVVFEFAFHWLFRGREKIVPLSACITGMGLSILLNYSHNYFLLFFPAFFAIASKYILTFEGKHVFNPNLYGVIAALTFGNGLFASSPAYQWGGTWAIAAFVIMGALSLFVYKIGRTPLITSFLVFYTIQTFIRAYILQWHVPMETIIYSTLSSPAFFLFTFYMITDPKTSPQKPWAQITFSLAVVIVDLLLHLKSSVTAQFFALFYVSAGRWAWLHAQKLWQTKGRFLTESLFSFQLAIRLVVLSLIGFSGYSIYAQVIHPAYVAAKPGFQFEPIPESQSGLHCELSDVLQEIDPRVQHLAKWLLSIGDAVAVADFDHDGLPDLFLTNSLKRPEDRNALYRNRGNFQFERIDLPALKEVSLHPEKYGLVAGALFVDYDNSGRQSLFLQTAYGKVILLKNRATAAGLCEFVDVTKETGLDDYCIGVAATFFDYDRDGRLDLLIGNTLATELPDYPNPTRLNIFKLPEPEYPGDRRMFHFMHHGWHNATNGGLNILYHNEGNGRFRKEDIASKGMPETHWTMAMGTGDFNQDGFTDVYCASDFGPDDLYLNQGGRHFSRVQGTFFGSIGKDTYKGMNVSVGDLDNRGWPDIYVSNVHAPLQAEGSLLWRTKPNSHNSFTPDFEDAATDRGLLNEKRFGWGAGLGDLNLDGWLDVVQANGMVDDTPDKKFSETRSYWYNASYVMRSGPEVHGYADRWGDLRGYDIFGHQADRVYLSRGGAPAMFDDVAKEVGLSKLGNSRAIALADFDDDGALDLAITHQFKNLDLYRNNLQEKAIQKKNWLGLSLQGDGQLINRDAVGTRVILRYTNKGQSIQQMREVSLTSGFSAQGDRRLLFGLGDYAGPVEIEIHWYGGQIEKRSDLGLNCYHTLSPSSLVLTAMPQH